MSALLNAREKMIIQLTDWELQTAIRAVLDACIMCSNKQIAYLGVPEKEKELEYYEWHRAECWSLQAKLRAFLHEPSSQASTPRDDEREIQ
jgi:hypothetical protein